MSRGYNFSSGPAALPEPVLRQAQAELLEWGGERASVLEVSHRGKAFMALAAESERDLRELLAVPSNYRILFLQGGATQHFAQIPMNLARGASADYAASRGISCAHSHCRVPKGSAKRAMPSFVYSMSCAESPIW